MNETQAFKVGEVFPGPLIDGGMYWDVDANMLIISGPGFHQDSDEDLRIDRVWISSLGPCITMTISTPIMTIDLPGVWTEQHPDRPTWMADDNTQAHLLLTAVWVDDSDKRIRKMQTFTISPHATQALITKARHVWTTPLPTQQAAAAMHAWVAAHPNPRDGKQAAFVTSRAGD